MSQSPHYTAVIPVPDAPPGKQLSIVSDGAAKAVTDHQIDSLLEQGFTRGLAESLSANKMEFPLRIWVVDNSGSMQMDDGNRIVQTRGKKMKISKCTRWDEITDCVSYHIQMASLIESHASFRLLNDPGVRVGPQHFDIGPFGPSADVDGKDDVRRGMDVILKAKPGGVTPLSPHIIEIHAMVQEIAPQLISEGKKVVIVLATDGLPSDSRGQSTTFEKNQFVQSLRLLEGLPVWVVIRLSTDDESVVDFYNSLDEQLELSMDVLDDFLGEAAEIYQHNPWFTYGLPMHRLREMGFHDRVLDMIDERSLTTGEVGDFCRLLFGVGKFDGVPDPSVDWKIFLSHVRKLQKKENLQWNPIKKKMTPWIDIDKLHKQNGDGTSCCIM